MASCARQTTAKYTGRPSPPYPAVPCEGMTKVGNDGAMWVSSRLGAQRSPTWKRVAQPKAARSAVKAASAARSATKKPITKSARRSATRATSARRSATRTTSARRSAKRATSARRSATTSATRGGGAQWVPVTPAVLAAAIRGKYVNVHDNGGKPFGVKLEAGGVAHIARTKIHRDYDAKRDTILGHEAPFATVRGVRKVWLGYGHDYQAPPRKPVVGDMSVGNNVLLETASGECWSVGMQVLTFKPDGPITDYVSVVGNNDVPYAYAATAKSVYFLEGGVTLVPRASLPRKDGEDDDSWYSAFFDTKHPLRGARIAPHKVVHARR